MKKHLLAAALLSLSCTAQAAGGYFGVGLGMSSVSDFSADEFLAAVNDGSLYGADADDSDTAFKLVGGARLNANFAIEVAYTDLGEFTAGAVSDGSGFFYAPGPVTYSAEASALSVGARLMAPVNDAFTIYGKLGFARWDFEDEFSSGGFSASSSDDGTDANFAIGVAVKAAPQLAVQLEMERFADVAESDIDILGLSLVYQFE